MKTKSFFGIFAFSLLTSCVTEVTYEFEQETEPTDMVFNATIESKSQTRTALSDYADGNRNYSLLWTKGDVISLSDGANTAFFETESDNMSSGVFYRKEGTINNQAKVYTAFYPSSITSANMKLPVNQNYVSKNVEGFPMRAISTDKNLEFKNLCGIIRFSLKTEEVASLSVTKISLSADNHGMSGSFIIDKNNAAVVEGTDGVVLSSSRPVSLYKSVATEFNIIVPKGDYNPLKVKIFNSEGKEINLISTDVIYVKRSEITNISLTLSASSFASSLETIPITDSDVEFTDR